MTFLRSLLLLLVFVVPASAAGTVWHPPAGVSGWFPKISPDGKYVAMGQGTLSVWNRETGALTRIDAGGGAYSGHWIDATTFTFVVEVGRETTYYSAKAPAFAQPFTKLHRGGTNNCAGGGAWSTNFVTSGATVVNGVEVEPSLSLGCDMDRDGLLTYIYRTGPGGGNFLSEKWVVKVRDTKTNTLLRTMTPPKGAPNVVRIGAGYVGYGYYGTSHMLTPTGAYVDVTVTSPPAEGPAKAFLHKGAVWVATSGDAGIYLRPLGDKRVITVPIPTVRVEAVSAGDVFVVAGNSDRGQLGVAVVLDSEPRAVLAPAPPVVVPPPPPPPVVVPPTVECGTFTAAEKDVLTRIGNLFPALRKSPEDEGRRQFNEKLAQQLDFTFPAKGWGMKRASKTRPISKDSVARTVDSALCGWDTVNGTTREMNLTARGEVLDPEQVYVDVTATNHLGVTPPPPPPPPVDCTVIAQERDAAIGERNVARNDLAAARAALDAANAAHAVEVDALRQRIAVLENAPPPSCRAKVPGWLSFLRIGCEIVK